MGVNKVILIGNLGRRPEIRYVEGGSRVATFSLATTERYLDRNGTSREHTEWHEIVCWGDNAGKAERLGIDKGDLVYIEGRIRSRSWEDRTGQQRTAREIYTDELMLIKKTREERQDGTPPEKVHIEVSEPEDGLPF